MEWGGRERTGICVAEAVEDRRLPATFAAE